MGIQLARVLFAWRRWFCKTPPIGNFYRNRFVKQVIWDMLAKIIHIMFTISYISERVFGNAIVRRNRAVLGVK